MSRVWKYKLLGSLTALGCFALGALGALVVLGPCPQDKDEVLAGALLFGGLGLGAVLGRMVQRRGVADRPPGA